MNLCFRKLFSRKNFLNLDFSEMDLDFGKMFLESGEVNFYMIIRIFYRNNFVKRYKNRTFAIK